MRGLHALTLAAALSAPPGPAAEPAKPPAVRLPAAPVAPAPVAPPAPAPAPAGDPSKLSADQWYVIDSDVPLIVLASPAGLVKVSEEAGPVKLKGRFVDGAGKVETRTYKGKHVYVVEAVASGRVELLVVPVGAASEKEVIRRTVDVDSGKGPIPPPKPVDPPTPKPPEPDPVVGPLRVIFVFESNKPLSREQDAAIRSPVVEKYLNERCAKDAKGRPEWNSFDPQQQFGPGFNPTLKELFATSLVEAKKVLPAVVVAVGRDARVYPVTTEAELLALLKRHAEGK